MNKTINGKIWKISGFGEFKKNPSFSVLSRKSNKSLLVVLPLEYERFEGMKVWRYERFEGVNIVNTRYE